MRRHLTPSLAVSVIALFVALGGSSYAAVKLNANSVGSREIKNGSITMADLNKSVRPQKSNKLFRTAVADTLLDPSTQAAVDALSTAVKGQPGDAGATGATGATGASGTASVAIRDAFGPTVGTGQHTGVNASCAAGERLVGGGARFEGTPQDAATMQFSAPDGNNGWQADYITGSAAGISGRAHVFALCAS